MYSSHLRLHVEPESLHAYWNDVRNAYKRSDCQPALLLGIVISNMAHGPYMGGGNQYTREEVAELLSQKMSRDQFEELTESMLRDNYGDNTAIPDSPGDIPDLPAVRNLCIFAVWTGLFHVGLSN